jgi:hypothetical protein
MDGPVYKGVRDPYDVWVPKPVAPDLLEGFRLIGSMPA